MRYFYVGRHHHKRNKYRILISALLISPVLILPVMVVATPSPALAERPGEPGYCKKRPWLCVTPTPSPSVSPSASPSPSVSPSPSISPSPSPSVSPSPSPSPITLRLADGGTNPFGTLSPALPNANTFLPITVWFESVLSSEDTVIDKDAGLNVYEVITRNSNLSIVQSAGMFVLPQQDEWFGGTAGRESGWFMDDEVDMTLGPGAGYTHMQAIEDRLPPNTLQVVNYGKGILFWETNTEAARFVNDWGHVVSADAYWMTDPNICGISEGAVLFGLNRALTQAECHRPSNYGLSVQRVRDLNNPRGSKPTWGFVEVGCPMTGAGATCMPAPSLTASVWHSIIAGARGISYFNHSFSGSCQTQHALREPCYAPQRAAVKAVNTRLMSLAPVINGPFADGLIPALPVGMRVMTKWYNDHFYIFAGKIAAGSSTPNFFMPCLDNATATVLDEGRSIPITGGSFTDTFADENAIHIYRIDGGSTCGL